MRTILSSSTARARAALVPNRWWIVSASMSWLSTVYTGSRHVAGSWKIMAISRPRIAAQLALGEPDELAPVELDRAGGDAAGRLEQAEDRQGGDALARARLADQGDGLAALDVERHVADGFHVPEASCETRAQAAHVQYDLRHLHPQLVHVVVSERR